MWYCGPRSANTPEWPKSNLQGRAEVGVRIAPRRAGQRGKVCCERATKTRKYQKRRAGEQTRVPGKASNGKVLIHPNASADKISNRISEQPTETQMEQILHEGQHPQTRRRMSRGSMTIAVAEWRSRRR